MIFWYHYSFWRIHYHQKEKHFLVDKIYKNNYNLQSWRKYVDKNPPIHIFNVVCVCERPWVNYHFKFSFLSGMLLVYVVCVCERLWRELCEREQIMCSLMTLVQISLANFNSFVQNWIGVKGRSFKLHKINCNPDTFILLRLYYYNQLNKTK